MKQQQSTTATKKVAFNVACASVDFLRCRSFNLFMLSNANSSRWIFRIKTFFFFRSLLVYFLLSARYYLFVLCDEWQNECRLLFDIIRSNETHLMGKMRKLKRSEQFVSFVRGVETEQIKHLIQQIQTHTHNYLSKRKCN